MRRPVTRLGASLALIPFGCLIAWMLCETALLTLLRHPPLLMRVPGNVQANVEELYRALDRPVIQADPQCARYDPHLFYTLRPGHCTYASREFSTRYEINRIGVRDDEASLNAPEIIVGGDSFAMGWGVDQDQTFAELLEKRTGRRVLNTAVSSYGTVREMRMLDRVDLSHARHLILHYFANDVEENIPFLRRGEHLEGSEKAYRDIVRADEQRRRYWPGRYSWWLLRHILEMDAPAEMPMVEHTETPPDEEPLSVQAEAFVNALQRAPHQKLDHVQLIVLAMWPPHFLDAVEELIKERPDLAPWIRDMVLVRFDHSPERYLLDDHWTPARPPGGRRRSPPADRTLAHPCHRECATSPGGRTDATSTNASTHDHAPTRSLRKSTS
jgi:hypothetical protein